MNEIFCSPPHPEKHRAESQMYQVKLELAQTVCSFFSVSLQQPGLSTKPVSHCTCRSDGSLTQNPLMLPLDLLPSSLAREDFYSQNKSYVFRLFPQLRNFSDNREDIYSAGQRATGCENMRQMKQTCFLHFLWKGRHKAWAYDASQK